MRYLLLIFVAGCSTAPAFTIEDRAGLGAFLAYEVVSHEAAPAPGPAPTPKPTGDVCPECDGAGKVGDGTVMLTCPECGGTGKKTNAEPPACQPADEPEPKPEPVSTYDNPVAPKQVYRLSGPRWTFENRGTNPPASFKAAHLLSAHGIDATGMTSEEMSALHDNCHSYGDDMAFGLPSLDLGADSDSQGGSCPTGRCPTSSSSGGTTRTVRRGLFGRRR